MFPLSDNRIEVQDLFGQSKQVDLDTGERTEMRYAKGGMIKVGDKVVITDEAVSDEGAKSNYGEVLSVKKEEIYGGAINTLVEVKTNDGKINVVNLQEVNKLYEKGGNIPNDEIKDFRDMFNDMDEEDFSEAYENITGEDFYDMGISKEEAITEIIDELNSMDSEGYDLEMVRLGLYAKGGMTGKKTYLLDSYFVNVYEDSYEQGELDMVHSWSSKEMQDAKREFPNKEALLNYLKDIIESQVTGQYELKDDLFEINDMGDGEVSIYTSVMAKYDDRGYGEYIYPTQDEKDMWKKGEQKLFSVYYTFYVEVYKRTNLSFW